MGVCESNKNQKAMTNNTQNVPNRTTQTSTLVNNATTPLPQSSNNKVITNNRNTLNGVEQQKILKQASQLKNNDEQSIDRDVSMGSSLNNEDSIGIIQTRNTVAV